MDFIDTEIDCKLKQNHNIGTLLALSYNCREIDKMHGKNDIPCLSRFVYILRYSKV